MCVSSVLFFSKKTFCSIDLIDYFGYSLIKLLIRVISTSLLLLLLDDSQCFVFCGEFSWLESSSLQNSTMEKLQPTRAFCLRPIEYTLRPAWGFFCYFPSTLTYVICTMLPFQNFPFFSSVVLTNMGLLFVTSDFLMQFFH